MAPPTTADAAEAFVLEKAKEYWEGEDEDGILWADFEYDFRGWTEPTFDLVSSKSLTKLRDNLKNRGVLPSLSTMRQRDDPGLLQFLGGGVELFPSRRHLNAIGA